jgi:hypothetical protein
MVPISIVNLYKLILKENYNIIQWVDFYPIAHAARMVRVPAIKVAKPNCKSQWVAIRNFKDVRR